MTRGRRGVLIPPAQEILKEYSSRITIRQLFYRLVSKGLIQNSVNAYNMFIQQMTIARRDKRIPYSVFEDRTRHSVEGEHPIPNFDSETDIFGWAKYTYEHAQEIALNQLTNAYSDYSLPFWHGQPCYAKVWLEKEALANLFEPICKKYSVSFVPTRG